MPLSPACSSVAVGITATKFIVSACWLYYKFPQGLRSIRELGSLISRNLLLEAGMSMILTIISVLLLVFSVVGPERALQVVLLIARSLLIIYQWGFMSLYCGGLPWLLWASLVSLTVNIVLSIVVASMSSHDQALVITLLSSSLVYDLVSFIVYQIVLRSQAFFQNIERLIRWNIGLCCVACAGSIASIVVYEKKGADLIMSLWIQNVAAAVWVLWVLLRQLKGLWALWVGVEEFSPSNKEMGIQQQDNLSRQGSTAQLVEAT